MSIKKVSKHRLILPERTFFRFKNWKHNFLSRTAFHILGVIQNDVASYNEELQVAANHTKDLEVS